ncbi:MAG: folylpolyglutamate synthase/dihydrofolate synthase family protein [Daejeonella sp.]
MPVKTYQETINYLYSRLPMFTRVGSSAYKADLNNTIEFCRILDNPHRKFKSIHVGGTNGKGSTSHMLAAILQIAGYKTGLYTSPHLRDFRERIRVNGQMIREEEVIQFVQDHQNSIEVIEPSFFEATVAMAFDHFARQKVDIAVIEVGLGGRLDSTNIINPLLSVITNIGYDHMNILGNTLPEIAYEKAGIIKPGIPIVIGQTQPETADIFIKRARETNSTVRFAEDEWNISKVESLKSENEKAINEVELLNLHITPSFNPSILQSFQPSNLQSFNPSVLSTLKLDLTGSYQLKNLATVLSAVDELCRQGFKITNEHIQTALKQVTTLTGLMGRWQVLSKNPLVICDTGHNEDGIREVLNNINHTPHHQLHWVIGMVKDKDISKILTLLPKDAHYYFCEPAIPRAKPVEELKKEAETLGLNGDSYKTVELAFKAAKENAKTDDLVFVGGSTFVVAEVV